MKYVYSKYSRILDAGIVLMVLLFGIALFYPRFLWKEENRLRKQSQRDMEKLYRAENIHYLLTNSYTDDPVEAVRLVTSFRDLFKKDSILTQQTIRFEYKPTLVPVEIPEDFASFHHLLYGAKETDSLRFTFGLIKNSELNSIDLVTMRKYYTEITNAYTLNKNITGESVIINIGNEENINQESIYIPYQFQKFIETVSGLENPQDSLNLLFGLADWKGVSRVDSVYKMRTILSNIQKIIDEDRTSAGTNQNLLLKRYFLASTKNFLSNQDYLGFYDTSFVFRYDSVVTDTNVLLAFEMFAEPEIITVNVPENKKIFWKQFSADSLAKRDSLKIFLELTDWKVESLDDSLSKSSIIERLLIENEEIWEYAGKKYSIEYRDSNLVDLMFVDSSDVHKVQYYPNFKSQITSPRTTYSFEYFTDSTLTTTKQIEVPKQYYEKYKLDMLFVREISGPNTIVTVEMFADSTKESIAIFEVLRTKVTKLAENEFFKQEVVSPKKYSKVHRKYFIGYDFPTEETALCEYPDTTLPYKVLISGTHMTITSPRTNYKWKKFGIFTMRDTSFGRITDGEASWAEPR